MAQKEKPAMDFPLGRIKAVIWPNRSENGKVWFNTCIMRRNKDDDQWERASSFFRDELPLVAKAADMAYAWIRGQDVPANPDEAVE